MTYNRPDCIQNSINSVLNQDFKDFQLIVSDNSNNSITQKLIEQKYKNPSFKYIKREPSSGQMEHLNLILSEIESDFFMIFHDDDVMHPTMLKCLHRALIANPEVLAAATNAFIIRNQKAAGYSFSYKENSFKDNTQLAESYLRDRNIAPFPSYMYRKQIKEITFFNVKNGGRYSDASFLMEIAKYKKILILNEPLMDYHIHSGQVSSSNGFIERSSLVNYIVRTTKFNRKSRIVKKYRIMNLYNEICKMKHEKKLNYSLYRLSKIYLMIFIFSPFNYFPKLVTRYLINYW